ncbi:peptidase [Marasmitruncus massiliensis]|jgi:hypothetical protein|uniref:peptidase n=1 Tax=Marasmitruncus massiliensis TaxID=1944642 RepID=UPI000C7BC9E9|nr:peptidase [Marasmitruncus massiliensis]
MKRILTLILIVLLLCGMLAPSVLAANAPLVSAETEILDILTDSGNGTGSDIPVGTATPSESEPVDTVGSPAETNDSTDIPDTVEDDLSPGSFDYTGSVISYTVPDALMGTLDMVRGDTGFTQLHNALDSVAISGTAEKDGTAYEISMPVTWDFSTVDAEVPGRYTAVGTIVIPEGAALADGLADTISISVQISAPMSTVTPAAITLTGFDEPDRTDAVAFAIGTSQETLTDWFSASVMGFSGYDAQGNYYDLTSGEWNLDAVDTTSANVYYAWTSPDLGTEYTLADGVSLPRQLCAVSIQTPGEPDINCCVAGRGFLRFPWVLSSAQEEQLDEFAVWLRQDGEEWVSLSDGFLFVSDGLQLSQRIFEGGSTYELKVTYPGGQTGVLTFQYDGELSILDYSGGDRDGGDAGGSNAGSGTQPAPTAPQTPGNSKDDNHQSGGNHTPAPDNSSSESNDAAQDSGSAPGESKKPQENQDSASGETGPAPTASQTPDDSQKNEKDNSDNNLSVQAPVTEKPAAGTPAVVAPSAVPVYSDVSHSHEAVNDASLEPENHVASQPDSNVKAVLNPLPDGNKTPQEEISGSQESAAVYESYSPTQTVISGLRLGDLCTEEENVVFGSGDVTVSIPSKLLLALNLSDTDTLTVILTQPEDRKILFSVEAAGTVVTELPGTIIRLRYTPVSENAEISVRNGSGEQLVDTIYEDSILQFTVNQTGTYTILDTAEASEKEEGLPPLLPVTGGLLLAAGGVVFFKRRRHG